MAAPRLEEFEFSTTTKYIIEIGNLYMRFFLNGAAVETAPDTPLELTTVYTTAQVAELQLHAVGDVIYITHPDVPVYKLIRTSALVWTISIVVFDEPPMLDENLTATTIAASGTTGSITLTATTAIFNDLHVGSYWKIGHKRNGDYIDKNFSDGAGNSGWVQIFGKFNIRTYGVWDAEVEIQKKLNGVTTTVLKFNGKSDRNVDTEAEAFEDAQYRIAYNTITSQTSPARTMIEWPDAVLYGIVKITAVASDGLTATATTIEDLEDTSATDLWSEGAWSDYRGYPRTSTLFEQRLLFGGTTYQPKTFWGSVTGDLENFNRGLALDNDSFTFSLYAKKNNIIQWMEAMDALVIGTASSVFRARGDDLGNAITPSRIDIKRKLGMGSEYIQPVVYEDTIFFVKRQKEKIIELIFDGSSDSFVSPVRELTLKSEHLFTSGIVSMSFQREPIPTLWVVNEDGQLLGGTYDRDQNVLGWARHESPGASGLFKSVACIYGNIGSNDEVWVSVSRTINSSERFFIERLNPTVWTDKEDAFFVDSGATYDGSPTNSFTGLSHLANEEIDVLADGVVYKDIQVDGSGGFNLPSGVTASKVQAGLRYESWLQPFRIDADEKVGVHMGRKKRIDGLKLVLKDSLGLRTYNGEKEYDETERFEPKGVDTDKPLFTGDHECDFQTGFHDDPTLIIKQTDPLPSNILAIIPIYEVTETK